MNCNCIKGIPGFDIDIKIVNSNTIIITDLSQWMDDETYHIPAKFSVLMVTPENTEFKIYLKGSNSKILKSEDIGVSKFTDGVYKFKILDDAEDSGGCGIYYEKSLAILPNLKCCISRALSTLEYDKVKEVEIWYKSALTSSEIGNFSQFMDEYKVAKFLLDKLNCNCNINC